MVRISDHVSYHTGAGAGCWVLGAGCWVLGAGAGCGCWVRVLGAGCWVKRQQPIDNDSH